MSAVNYPTRSASGRLRHANRKTVRRYGDHSKQHQRQSWRGKRSS